MDRLIASVKEKAAGRTVVLPVFGDAESLSAVAICALALTPQKVFAICIDHGMLRKNELELISAFLKKLSVGFKVVDAEKSFAIATVRGGDGKVIGPLSCVYSPREKRDIITYALNKCYFDCVENDFGDSEKYLITGMHGIGGDSIVEITGAAMKIAKDAGADEMLCSQPFPVSALAIRMLCNQHVIALTTEQRQMLSDIVSKTNAEFGEKLIPLRSVGICNGERSYKCIAALSHKGVTGDYKQAFELSRLIDDSLPFVNRVVFRVDSDRHAANIHSKPLYLNGEALDVLREADAIVAKEFITTNAAQFFAVLIPIVSDKEKRFSIVIRAVSTSDYKTAKALVPGVDFPLSVLEKTVSRIKNVLDEYVDMIFYDITSKPPAAIEFE